MYLTKLAQRNGDDSNAVTYSDLAAVVQVCQEHDPLLMFGSYLF